MPSAPLAEALAAEWASQGEFIEPMSMPLTRLVNSALDGVAARTSETAEEIVKYAGSDLLFYRADGPSSLVARQAAHWDPVLDFMRERLGARFVLSGGHTIRRAACEFGCRGARGAAGRIRCGSPRSPR